MNMEGWSTRYLRSEHAPDGNTAIFLDVCDNFVGVDRESEGRAQKLRYLAFKVGLVLIVLVADCEEC